MDRVAVATKDPRLSSQTGTTVKQLPPLLPIYGEQQRSSSRVIFAAGGTKPKLVSVSSEGERPSSTERAAARIHIFGDEEYCGRDAGPPPPCQRGAYAWQQGKKYLKATKKATTLP